MAPLPKTRPAALAGVILALVFCTAAPRDAPACTCVVTTDLPTSAADLLANHAAIFEGRVVGGPEPPDPPPDGGYQERLASLEAKVERLTGVREVHFDVLRAWKGAAERAVVRTQAQRTACGYPFEVGRTYLVLAERREDGSLWAGACGRTRPSEEAAADRALLDAHAGGTPPPTTPPRAGCAGCTAAPEPGTGGLAGLALAFLAAARRRKSLFGPR